MTGTGAPSGGSGSGYAGATPYRSYEERQQARESMMNSIRETSQQDRRVYVGNLSYDVKWHHLKDFMRQGGCPVRYSTWVSTEELTQRTLVAGEVLFADVLLLPNGMSKVGVYM
jgi:hypothetical protein